MNFLKILEIETMKLDVLVFAAHPDDAELSMGGTIAKLTNAKYKVGIADLTKGELGTRGNEQTRKKEKSRWCCRQSPTIGWLG